MKDRRTIKYCSNEGQEILVEVPWPLHSGMIPPPEIIFYHNGKSITFIYRGSE